MSLCRKIKDKEWRKKGKVKKKWKDEGRNFMERINKRILMGCVWKRDGVEVFKVRGYGEEILI